MQSDPSIVNDSVRKTLAGLLVLSGLVLGIGHPIAARAAAPRIDPVTTRLVSLLANVTNATTYRYRATDDAGRTLDCLKIHELAPGDYLGVYHTLRHREFQLHLARSTNLLHWTHRAVEHRA